MNRIKVKTIDDLPELPFERILSYLSLGDLLKSRTISRGWRERINHFRVKRICCSDCPGDFHGTRMVSGAFDQNFIGSPRLQAFFTLFGPTILANLKHLRLFDLRFKPENLPAFFQALNKFDRLEELDMNRFNHPCRSNSVDFELNLPMLRSIRLEVVAGIGKLILDTPRLQNLIVGGCDLGLIIVHSESVKRLIIGDWQYVPVKNLKSLQYLHVGSNAEIDPAFLSSLEKLKEIHLEEPDNIRELFEQKRRCGRSDLKIYRFGCLLDGPADPLISSARSPDFAYLVENRTRLADELPLCNVFYEEIEPVDTQLAVSLLKKCTNLETILVKRPVENVQRFLDLLKNVENIVGLEFDTKQPQELFDRLPEHCAAKSLTIYWYAPSDFKFLFRMKSLKYLALANSMSTKFIRKVWEELTLSSIYFHCDYHHIQMEITHSKQIRASIDLQWTTFRDLNAAIQFIAENVEKDSDRDSEEE